jgi:hypothetical protein
MGWSCCSLALVTRLIAWLTIILSLRVLAQQIYFSRAENPDEPTTESVFVNVTVILVHIVYLTTAALLLIGSKTRSWKLCLPWLIYTSLHLAPRTYLLVKAIQANSSYNLSIMIRIGGIGVTLLFLTLVILFIRYVIRRGAEEDS